MIPCWPMTTGANAPGFYVDFASGSLVPVRGGVSPTFTRATVATVIDWESVLRSVLSGEVRFTGLRRVYNRLLKPEDFTDAAWTKTNCNATAGATDPNGGSTAFTITATGAGAQVEQNVAGLTSFSATNSMWMKRRTGSGTIRFNAPNGSGTQDVTLTSAWQRFSITGTGASYLWFNILTGGDAIDVWHPQFEIVTGQSNQNPAEYVSVGVLSAPYHGANVDGVKYFPYENGNTVSSNVVTEATGSAISTSFAQYLYLPGTSGNYASTPDSVANSITGDIDIRVKVALDDWAKGAFQSFIGGWNSDAANKDRYWFQVGSNDLLQLGWNNGSTGLSIQSSVAPPVAAGAVKFVRVTLDVNNGAGGRTGKFYTSDDGITWLQLGSTVTQGGVTSIADRAEPILVGALNAGSFGVIDGKIYRAQVLNGIDGPVVVDFNPADAITGATSFVSSATGETWTINQSGSPAAAMVFPGPGRLGYLAEGAATSRCLHSQEFDNAVWAASNVTKAANEAVAPDGTTTADTLTATAANGTVIQDLGVVASAAKSGALWIKRKTGTGNIDLTLDGGSTWTTQAVTTTWTRFSITQTLADEDFGIRIVTSGDAVWVWQGQVETASFISSDIVTTTAAVTRNADVLTYTTSGWFNATEGAFVATYTPSNLSASAFQLLGVDDGTTNEQIYLYSDNSGPRTIFAVVDGGASQANFSLGNINAVGSQSKTAAAYKLNDLAGTSNGGTVQTDTSATIPTVTTLRIALITGGSNYFGNYASLAIYTRRPTNAQLQGLTT